MATSTNLDPTLTTPPVTLDPATSLLAREATCMAPIVSWFKDNIENGSLVCKVLTYSLLFFAAVAAVACALEIPLSCFVIVPMVVIAAMEYAEQVQEDIARHNEEIRQDVYEAALNDATDVVHNQYQPQMQSLRSHERAVLGLNQTVAQKTDEINQLQQQLQGLNQLGQDKTALQAQLNQKLLEFGELKRNYDALVIKANDMQTNLETQIDAKTATFKGDLEGQIAALKAELDPLKQEIVPLRKKTTEAVQKAIDLEVELRTANETLSKLTPVSDEEKTQLSEAVQKLTEELTLAKGQRDIANNKLNETVGSVKTLEATIRALTEEKTQATEATLKSQEEATLVKGQLTAAKEQLDTQEKLVQKLQTELQALNEVTAKIAPNAEGLKAIPAQIKALQEQVEQLTRLSSEKQTEIERLKEVAKDGSSAPAVSGKSEVTVDNAKVEQLEKEAITAKTLFADLYATLKSGIDSSNTKLKDWRSGADLPALVGRIGDLYPDLVSVKA